MPWLCSRSATAKAIGANAPTATSSTSALQPVGRRREHVHSGAARNRRNIFADIAFRKSDRGGAVVDVKRLAKLLAQPGAVAGRGDPHAGHDAQYRQVPHAVVAGAVRAGDPGPVEHHGDRQLVHRHVHHDLVERPVEERRIDGHHRVQAAHRQAGRRRDRVLLGDADVEQPIRETLSERRQPGGAGHRSGDRDDVAAFSCVADQRFGERRRPARPRDLGGLPGRRVDHPAGMHLFGLVGLGRAVAHALARDDVHDHRTAEAAGTAQRGLHGMLVMAVDRPDVLQSQVGEHQLRRQRVLDAGLDAVHDVVGKLADDRHPADRAAAPFQ